MPGDDRARHDTEADAGGGMTPMTTTAAGGYAAGSQGRDGERDVAPHDMPGLDRWTRAGFRLLARIAVGQLTVVLPDGRSARFDGGTPGPEALVRLRDRSAVRRFMLGGDLAFAEAITRKLVVHPGETFNLKRLVVNRK